MKLADLTPYAGLTQKEQSFVITSFDLVKKYHDGHYDDGIIVIRISNGISKNAVKLLKSKLREHKIRLYLDDTSMIKKEKCTILQFMPEFKLLDEKIKKIVQHTASSIHKLLKEARVGKLTPASLLEIGAENYSHILCDEKAIYALEKYFIKKGICRTFSLHYIGSKIVATLE